MKRLSMVFFKSFIDPRKSAKSAEIRVTILFFMNNQG